MAQFFWPPGDAGFSGGTITANQGTPGPINQPWPVLVTDGTDSLNINPDGSSNVLVKNALLDVVYDTLQVTAVNVNNDPTTILAKTGGLAGITVKTLTIAYDGLGDFQSVAAT